MDLFKLKICSIKSRNNLKKIVPILVLGMVFFVSCKSSQSESKNNLESQVANVLPKHIIAKIPGQNPEGIEFDKNRKWFFLSAINSSPAIVTVGFNGTSKVFSKDTRVNPRKSFGLEIDYENNRLLACANNLESGNVDIYNLTNGELENSVNLSSLLSEKEAFQANDLVVVNDNTIFVTGRLENIIYKIDQNLKPSIFFRRDGLTRPNGIVYHPDGYLLVAYYTNKEADLVKIPLGNPYKAEIITIKDFDFKGFDGMILTKKRTLIGVAKDLESGAGIVVELSSGNDWKTAKTINEVVVKRSSTIAQVNEEEYYVINQDWKNKDAEDWIIEYLKF